MVPVETGGSPEVQVVAEVEFDSNDPEALAKLAEQDAIATLHTAVEKACSLCAATWCMMVACLQARPAGETLHQIGLDNESFAMQKIVEVPPSCMLLLGLELPRRRLWGWNATCAALPTAAAPWRWARSTTCEPPPPAAASTLSETRAVCECVSGMRRKSFRSEDQCGLIAMGAGTRLYTAPSAVG